MPKGDTRGSKKGRESGEGRKEGVTEEPPLLNRGNIKKI